MTPCLRAATLSLAVAAALPLGFAGAASARTPRVELGASGLTACPGAPMEPTRVVEGAFPQELEGAYVMLPFEVPEGTTEVRVRYCWEDGGHTLDLGLWDARRGARPWGPAQFRGWGGSSHPDVAVSVQGFSDEATYLAEPRGYVPGRTTRGFVPGPLPAGEWAVELGVGAVVGAGQGDDDGLVAWRVEIGLSDDAAFAAEPYVPAPYSEAPVRVGPAWYEGDMHVHAEHSALGDATMAETFEDAFRPLEEGGAGLDFLTLSDYVTTTGWGEIGRYQALHPEHLIVPSAEIITYEGHANNHASRTYVDHRAGPAYELRADGTLRRTSRGRPPRRAFRAIRRAGGWTQLNHVATCPSHVDYCRRTCRGCPWDHDRRATRLARVDAIEVANGPLDVFTAGAIAFWEDALDRGHRIAAVGSSDAHHADSPDSAISGALGDVTTVVYARELSVAALGEAVRAGRTVVKMGGSAGPELRLEARVAGSSRVPAIVGDVVRAHPARVQFEAHVLGVEASDPAALLVVKDGEVVAEIPVAKAEFHHAFPASGPGRYRLQLERPNELLALTSPIYLKRGR